MYKTRGQGLETRKLIAVSITILFLASLVAGSWSVIRPQADGRSDLNADTVDGKHAWDLGGEQNLSQVLERGDSAGSYNLNMSGNVIQEIGGLQNCGINEFVAGNGQCTTDSFAADTDNQDLQDVLSQGNSAGSRDINLTGQEIIDTSGSITLGGGNVEIPNGNLNVNNNNVSAVECLGDEC